MSQPSLFDAHQSYTDRLIELFTGQPGEWFDGLGLARVAGAYAWRSRVSDARRRLRASGQGDIINEQRRGPGRVTRSLYRFEPTGGQS